VKDVASALWFQASFLPCIHYLEHQIGRPEHIVSFGFGVSDFIAVGALVRQLYRAFANAPGDFREISRELSSFYIVIDDLRDEVEDESSQVNRQNRKQNCLHYAAI